MIDDETRVYLDPGNIAGNEYYHCLQKSDVADKYRFKREEKFPKKYLIWQCIDERGNVSDSFISEGTMNAETYLKVFAKAFVAFYNKTS